MPCAALPVVGARVLSPFGARASGQHYGVDLAAREGSAVYAVREGVVRFVALNGELERYGITVVIDHGPWLSLSSHLSSAHVEPGQRVRAGQVIGTVGRTAGTRANPGAVFTDAPPHLHLEFLEQWPVRGGGGGRMDPAAVLAELGVVVPAEGPIFSACDDVRVVQEPRHASGAGLLLVAVGLWYAHKRGLL